MTDSEDQAIRRQALDTDSSFCVTAPAGSGKTELLTQRFLKLLARVERPEQILAITFTRKAAAEMRARILLALHSAQTTIALQASYKRQTWELARLALANDATRGWQLLENPARLRVQTIDSLCQHIAREQPVVTTFGDCPQTVDNAGELYSQAVDSLLSELEGSGSSGDDIAEILLHLDNNLGRLRRLLMSLLARRDQWLPYVAGMADDQQARQQLTFDLDTWVTQELWRCRTALLPFEASLMPLLAFAARQLQLVEPSHAAVCLLHCQQLPDATAIDLPVWQALVNLLLTSDGTVRRAANKNIGFPAASSAGDKLQKVLFKKRKDEFQTLLGELRQQASIESTLGIVSLLPVQGYQPYHWRILAALTRVLKRAVAHLALVFGATGKCDHTAIMLAAQASLGDELDASASSMRWDRSLEHILVDEFQDTSLVQFSLLERLTASWAADNAVQSGYPRTVFLVGDGMQSVYSFRAAKVGLFVKAREQGLGNLPLTSLFLTQNFRSTSAIVNWNNRVFAQAFPTEVDIGRGAVPYHAASAMNMTGGHGVNLRFFADQPEQSRVSEAQQVVDIIRQRLAESPTESIAILVRSRGHLAQIIPALMAADLTWQATDIDPLRHKQAVIDVVSLYSALSNPADKLSWAAVLRAPWCGLELSQLQVLHELSHGLLAEFVIALNPAALAGLPFDAAVIARLQRVVPVLQLAWQERSRKPVRMWLEGVWLALGGPVVAASSAAIDAVMRVLERLQQAQENGLVLSPAKLQEELVGSYANDTEVPNCRIQLMTIHKSKGLEFDTVILPCLDKTTSSDSKPLLHWREHLFDNGHGGLVMCPLDAAGGESDLYRFLQAENRRAHELEDLRLLYVAATRARKNLYLLAALNRDTDSGELKPPGRGSLLHKIWNGIRHEAEQSCVNPSPRVANGEAHIDRSLQRLSASWNVHTGLPERLRQPGIAGDYKWVESANIAPGETSAERAVGVLVHRILDLLVHEGLAGWDHPRLVKMTPHWRQLLKYEGLAESEIETILATVTTAIANTMNDATGRWILSNHHEHSRTEWRVSKLDKASAKIMHYVIDRVFTDNGNTWIIDYKLVRTQLAQTPPDFIAWQQETWREQLRNYKEICEQMAMPAVRCGLYFPLQARFHEVVFGVDN